MGRVETRKDAGGRGRPIDRQARLAAMKRQWDPKVGAYRCHYTGISLDMSHGTRRHATWEHLTPGDESSVVLASALVNRMKSDMTDAEFQRMVGALARHFEGASFDGEAFPAERQ